MLRKRILAAATAAFLALGMAVGGASPAMATGNPDNTNTAEYWQEQYPDAIACYKYGSTGSNEHGSVINGAVVLKPYGANWPGDRWEVLIVKGGSVDYGDGPGDVVYELPEAGVAYYPPLNKGGQVAGVSHWIVCKGESDEPQTVTPSATPTDATCEVTTGSILFASVTGIESYSLNGQTYAPGSSASGLEPGQYSVSATAANGYQLAGGSSPFTVTVGGPADGECDEEPTVVVPAFTVVDEDCLSGTVLAGGSITLDTQDGRISYVVTDSEGNEVTDLTDLAPGTYTVTPTAVGEGVVLDLLSYDDQAVVSAYEGECAEPETVVPAFTVVDETCVSGILLEGGSITLDDKGGTITYVVTDAEGNEVFDLTDLAPGTYTVTPTAIGDVELDLEGYDDQAVIAPFDGECGSVLPITDASIAFLDPTCESPEQLDEPNFEFDSELAELESIEVDDEGNFTVVFRTLDEGTRFFQGGDFGTASHSEVTRTVSEGGTVLTFTGTLAGPNTELCPELVVLPEPVVVDDCFEQSVTLTDTEGVAFAYSVNGGLAMPVEFGDDDTVTIEADPFDTIVVTATAEEGYVLDEGYEPWEYTFAFPEDCLPTGPLTSASVTWTQPDCLGNPGSYTLTNGLGVIWTVDGVVVPGNAAYSVAAGATPTIQASLEGPSEEYPLGFGWEDGDQQTLWNLSFLRPANCDLPTLALTGASNALAGLGIAAVVIMMAGTGLVIARRREAARVQG